MFLAKLKGKRGAHQILMQDSELRAVDFYIKPNILEATKYNPDKKLDQDQWFYVEVDDMQKQSMLGTYLELPQSSADLNHARVDDYKDIEAVYKTLENNEIIFTKITDSYKIENKILLKFHDTENAEITHQQNSIVFSGKADAYFDGEKKLYFRNYNTIRPLFPGIEDFFRAATHDEINKFLRNNFFDVDQNITPETVGQRAAKNIASILDDDGIDIESDTGKSKVLEYAANYPEAGVEVSEIDKIIIKDKKDLGKVISLLSSRYYTSEVTGKKMQSFGSTKIEEE